MIPDIWSTSRCSLARFSIRLPVSLFDGQRMGLANKATWLEENRKWIDPPTDYTLYAPLPQNVPFW